MSKNPIFYDQKFSFFGNFFFFSKKFLKIVKFCHFCFFSNNLFQFIQSVSKACSEKNFEIFWPFSAIIWQSKHNCHFLPLFLVNFGKNFQKLVKFCHFCFFFKNFVVLLCKVDLKHSPKKLLNFFGLVWGVKNNCHFLPFFFQALVKVCKNF